jgi:hypothetical protein
MTWTNIPDTNIEPGKPVRSIDMIAMRDNIPALANGDTGAPRIKTAAIDAGQVTNDKLQPPVAGDLYTIARFIGSNSGIEEFFGYSSFSAEFSQVTGRVGFYVNNESFTGNVVRAIGFNCLVSGSIRLYIEALGYTSYRVLKNGVQIQSIFGNTGWVGRNLDISVGAGDNITVQFASTYFRNMVVKSNNPNFAVA